jgi:hypothetical protein
VTLKTVVILGILVAGATVGVLLVRLYANVSDTGWNVLDQLRYCYASGDWRWMTGKRTVGWLLIGGAAVGFVVLAGAIVLRSRDRAKDAKGFRLEK